MADIQPSETSTAVPAAVTPIKDLSFEDGRRGDGEKRAEEVNGKTVDNTQESVEPHDRGEMDAPQASHDASVAKRHKAEGDDGEPETGNADHSSSSTLGMVPFSCHDPASHANDDATTSSHDTVSSHIFPPSAQSPTEPPQTHIPIQQPPVAPLKRFTAVNINKRFLEKTPSTSGAPLGGSSHANHVSSAANATGSGQRRGVSPSCMWQSVLLCHCTH